ncbi:hypothetical protein SVEN_7001 [Streptomyces venezuelae ATCC 10712]|uniref:Uncharacterized protein n=1 Tax=Streptomyces venezuelae (strain ATCC 10712 / CBS 650.69 / DSM 40230 / JCM 4526 / NBRC 13096 / PD 04745) TaxID=953739 RepID=F2RKD1_STRVP|nr:hypothetical protein SVEN_7001 [Streptomyces venezuelae ATCC 10712]
MRFTFPHTQPMCDAGNSPRSSPASPCRRGVLHDSRTRLGGLHVKQGPPLQDEPVPRRGQLVPGAPTSPVRQGSSVRELSREGEVEHARHPDHLRPGASRP